MLEPENVGSSSVIVPMFHWLPDAGSLRIMVTGRKLGCPPETGSGLELAFVIEMLCGGGRDVLSESLFVGAGDVPLELDGAYLGDEFRIGCAV